MVQTKNGDKYAMKTFRKQKSSNMLLREANLQKMASDVGIAPNIIDIDTVSKYIVMEKLDRHLLDIIKDQNGIITKEQQKQIVSIYKNLDKVKVFHGDSNLLNFMYKGSDLYIIDFGVAKEITPNLVKNLGTNTPNVDIMIPGIATKLKEKGFSRSSYKYIIKCLSDYQKSQYGFQKYNSP